MDWGKAKSILITVFIFLNIFLLVNISLNKFSKTSSKEAIANTIIILENKGIELENDIPDNGSPMGRLKMLDVADFDMTKAAERLLDIKVEFPKELKPGANFTAGSSEFIVQDTFSFTYINNSPKASVDISREKSVERYVRKFLEDAGIKESEFLMESYEKTPDGSIKAEFIQKYQGAYIFSNTISTVVTDMGLKELSCSISKPDSLSSKADSILPAYKILLTNFGDLSNLVITSIDIGYNIDKIDNGKPVWRVKIKDSDIKWFDASTGVEK